MVELLEAPHTAVWCVDTEYKHEPGERDQRPICLVARELYSGRLIRLWEDEILRLRRPPFATDERSIVVVYGAFAELGTFAALGWPEPARLLDLHPEFRAVSNDGSDRSGSLLAALAFFGLPHMSVEEKEACRRLIMEQDSWNQQERRRIVRYCQADVDALIALVRPLLHRVERFEEAFLRSDYAVAIAAIGRAGIPMDGPALDYLQRHWDQIRAHLATEAHAVYGAFPDGSFNAKSAEAYLAEHHLLDVWPLAPKSGRPSFDKEVLRDMCRLYPRLNLLREVKASVGKVRPVDLDIGSDGRCRSPLYPFGTVTGRNAPRRFPFSPATWTRSLVRPFPGRAIAYLDYSGQELALAAAYAGDQRMQDAYASGDFYLSTAKAFRIAPADATKQHPARDLAKTLCLGLNYGMTTFGLADRLDIGLAEAEDLLNRHRATYAKFWAFSDAMVTAALFNGRLISSFGWPLRLTRNLDDNGRTITNPRGLRNFMFQSGGGDMLRLGVIGLLAAGILVIATVHDAVLIEADAADIEDHVAVAKTVMVAASELVSGGFPLRVDHRIFQAGERYFDPRGVAMWNRIVRWVNTRPRLALAA